MTTDTPLPVLTAADFASDQDVRWCPGCGDYSILAQMKKVLPHARHRRARRSCSSRGIGCSSRFPYYMNTYGIHSHPRPRAGGRHRPEVRAGPTCRCGSSPATATACRSAATT